MTGLPVWAALSAWGVESLRTPPEVDEVVVYADHDASGVGQQAGHRLAERLKSEGRRARVEVPPEPGTDWADVWLAEAVEKGGQNE